VTYLLRLWPVALGALAGLGQAPWGVWSVTLIALTILFVQYQKTTNARSAARLGWAFGLGYFLVSLSWLIHPFLVEPERHAWLIPFALLAMCGGLAVFWGGAFFVARKYLRSRWGLVAIWAAAELARGYFFTGFPWALMGYVWLDTPIAQLASIVGPYGLTLLTFALGAAIAQTIGARTPYFGVGVASGVIALFAGGVVILHANEVIVSDQTIRLVQPNAPQDQKWDPEYIPEFYARALDLTTPDAAGLVIWPETALATPLYDAQEELTEISKHAMGAQVLVGVNHSEMLRWYNSIALIDTDGTLAGRYDKHHLVPFGEYLPFDALMAQIGLSGMTAQAGYGYSAGEGVSRMDIDGYGAALPLICYEASFPRNLRSETRADWVLQLTNDAWFGPNAGPQQSLAQARFRAIETGLPVVRSANTGVSAIIDPQGRVTTSLPLGVAGALEGALPKPFDQTVYARLGEVLVAIAIVLILTGAGLVGRGRA